VSQSVCSSWTPHETDAEVAKGADEVVAVDAEDPEHPGAQLAAVNEFFEGLNFLPEMVRLMGQPEALNGQAPKSEKTDELLTLYICVGKRVVY